MTIARAELIDIATTRWYHCVTRCARNASLLAGGPDDRRPWVEQRLETLAEIFAVSVGAYSVMDDRVQLLLRMDPHVAKAWSAEEVVRRRGRIFPPYDRSRRPLPISKEWVLARRKDVPGVAAAREQLQSIGWFMKCLKEPLARLANRQDSTRGAFFEARFKSVAILDDESLLAASAHIDLSAVAAEIAEVPQASPYSSIKKRVAHVKAQRRSDDLKAAKGGLKAGSKASAKLEDSLWLCPIEDRRKLGSSREGMMQGLSLGSYLLLLNYSGRVFREGKASVSEELTEILDRVGYSAENWQDRLEKLKNGRLFGRFSAASRERLREVAKQLGVHHLANLSGMPER